MMETLANGYSSDRTQQVLSNGHRHDRVFKDPCVSVFFDESSLSIERVEKGRRMGVGGLLCHDSLRNT